MKVLVHGRSGQLARALAGQTGWRFVGRDEADLAVPGAAAEVIAAEHPGFVVNAAAYTDVDGAETHPALAERVNALAVGEIAAAAAGVGAGLLHISTDYVFPGTSSEPHDEDAAVDPLGVYGRTKLAGERAARAANRRTVILRTAWLYAPWGRNFVRIMLEVAREHADVRVVDDQRGSPTSALDLARACRRVVAAMAGARPDDPRWGVYHFAGQGVTTWAGFARAILERAGLDTVVRAIAAAEYPTPARRPQNSALDSRRFARTFGLAPRPWPDALSEVLARMGEAKVVAE